MSEIEKFFADIRLDSGAIWVEEEAIRLSTSKRLKNETIRSFVADNRQEIISILRRNKIFSTEKFLSKKILANHLTNEAPLSHAQERLWFVEQYDGGAAYHMPAVLTLEPHASVAAIKYALRKIGERHEVLRSTIEYSERDGIAKQVVHPGHLGIEELYTKDKSDLDERIESLISKPFDLTSEFPIRVALISSSTGVTLVINLHHIATDGWSMNIFQNELEQYYNAFVKEDIEFDLPPLEIQYKDYAIWQRRKFGGEALNAQLEYWKDRLLGFEMLRLPLDFIRPTRVNYGGATVPFCFDDATTQKIRRFAKDQGTTIHCVLMAALNVLLAKHSGQHDVVIGTPIANRHHWQTEGLIGFFVNMQAHRTRLTNDQSFTDLVSQMHADQVAAQHNQDLPFEKLIAALNVERDLSRHPVFQVTFEVKTQSSEKNTAEPSWCRQQKMDSLHKLEKFDLSVLVNDSPKGIGGIFSYATSLFKQKSIEFISERYLFVVRQLLDSPGAAYQSMSIVTDNEKSLIASWNNTGNITAETQTICELFDASVNEHRDNVAIVFGHSKFTYRDLDEKVNQLVRYLRSEFRIKNHSELTPDTLIGVCAQRSPEMIISILAILKAGAAFVPIDPSYPHERIKYILDDTKAFAVLVTSGIDVNNAITIDLRSFVAKSEDTTTLLVPAQATSLAYIIYTSGTTGRPKGVMIEHGALSNYLVNNKTMYSGDAPECGSFIHLSLSFDASLTSLLMPLINGKATVIIPETLDCNLFDDAAFGRYKHADFMKVTPSHLELLKWSRYKLSCKKLVVGGEALQYNHVHDLLARYPGLEIINEYGPTEATVGCAVHSITHASINENVPIAIGTPIDNCTMYILETDHKLCPIGVWGEIYIGGAGLARGYHNRSDLTDQRFIKNPFASPTAVASGHSRLYKTGDIGRWTSEGIIEYGGRNDDQVKLRGYRIELAEIENAFSQIPGIQQCCVAIKKIDIGSGSQQIVGYYVADSTLQLTSNSIIEQLSQRLPQFMVPTMIVKVQQFPLTVNGKLDRNLLPLPLPVSSVLFAAPENDMHSALCSIWKDALGLDKVSIDDDFFRIGGDSIISIQVIGRMRQSGLNCQVKNIFEHRTIRKLANYLSKSEDIKIESEQGLLTGEFSLLPIQKHFFLQVSNGQIVNPGWVNQSFLIRIPCLDLEVLSKAIKLVVAHHDALRLRFTQSTGKEWRQAYGKWIDIPELITIDINTMSPQQLQQTLTEMQNGFDVNKGPLFSMARITGYSDGSARLFFAFHHLIIDTVSLRIIIDDLAAVISGKLLPAKTSSYRQWVNAVRKYSLNNKKEIDYWNEQLRDIPIYKKNQLHPPSEKKFLISEEQTHALLRQCIDAYHTEIDDLLLTALAYALRTMNGGDVQAVTLEGHGRENFDSSMDTSHTVGWLTTMAPLKLQLQDNIANSIMFIKETLRHVPEKGIGFAAFASEGMLEDENRLPSVSFNYLGQFEAQPGNWQIVAEASGVSNDPRNWSQAAIDINGMVTGNRLVFSVATQLGDEFSTNLANAFKSHLLQIIDHCVHCLQSNQMRFTPSDFADYVPFEVINENNSGDPIFLFPPSGGGLETYMGNIAALESKKMIVLNNFHLFLKNKNIDNSLVTFEELGAYYRLLIKTRQPSGSYNLFGYSMGGVVAFETARQLVESGSRISNLVLLDPKFAFKMASAGAPNDVPDFRAYVTPINFDYWPPTSFTNTHICLLKSTRRYTGAQAQLQNETDLYLENFYIDATYNGMDEHINIDVNRVEVVMLDCDHVTMLENRQVVYAISDLLCAIT